LQIVFGDAFEIIDIVEIDVVEIVDLRVKVSSEFIRHPDAQKIDVFSIRGFEKSFCHKVNIGGVDRDM